MKTILFQPNPESYGYDQEGDGVKNRSPTPSMPRYDDKLED